MARASVADALARGLRSPVLRADDEVAPYMSDFGAMIRRRPAAVAMTGSEAELAHVLRVARRAGVPVTLRGAGHSCGGQTLDTGIVVVNVARTAHVRLLADDRIEVTGRTRWDELTDALAQRGRTMPVMTNFGGTTVGGTLAIGGYGVTSAANGAQVDHVERLRLVLPDGEARWCSPDEHPELFHHSLGGLGQLGAIERVVMRTVRREPLRWESRRHGSLGELAEAARALAAGTRAFFGEQRGGETWSHTGRLAAADEPPVPENPPAPGFPPTLRHVWCDYAVGPAALVPFAQLVERLFGDDPLRTTIQRIYLLGLRRAAPASALDLRGSSGEPLVFGIGVNCTLRAGDERLADVVAAQRELLDACIAAGGRPYLCGTHMLDETRRRALYGDPYARLLELRAELDPHGLFNRFALGPDAAPPSRRQAATPQMDRATPS